jgi:hypothetical protein
MTNTISTPIHIKAKLGLQGVADMDVVKALTAAYNGVLNNSAFSTPPFDLASFKAGIDKFSALIIDAGDGGKKAISAKNKQRVAVIEMYTQLGHYVESACNNDVTIFNISGFTQVAKPVKTPPVPLTEAAFSSIDRRPNSGDVVVQPEKQTGAIAFDVHYALVGAGGALGPCDSQIQKGNHQRPDHGWNLSVPDPCVGCSWLHRLDGYQDLRSRLTALRSN